MAGNDSIQILRGTASNIAASNETLLDGQLLYDKTNNKLFIGNGEQPVNSATQIGGMEGLSIYRSNQILMTTASSYINKNTIAVPDGRTIQNGDLIIANSTYSYLYTVIDNRPNYANVEVDYLQSLRGASGSSGTGSDGKGVFYSNVAAVDGTVQIRRSTLNQPSGFTAGVGDIILANSRLFYINASSGTGSASIFGVNMIANLIGDRGATGSSVSLQKSFNAVKFYVTTTWNTGVGANTLSGRVYFNFNTTIDAINEYASDGIISEDNIVPIMNTMMGNSIADEENNSVSNISSINIPATGTMLNGDNRYTITHIRANTSNNTIAFYGENSTGDEYTYSYSGPGDTGSPIIKAWYAIDPGA